MARPLCKVKRQAIIDAALELFAEQGLSAPTSKIAKLAQVSEGTIFTYFKNKDDLIVQVYLSIKEDIHKVIKRPRNCKEVLSLFKSNWLNYTDWLIKNPQKHYLLGRIFLSKKICETAEEQFQTTQQDLMCHFIEIAKENGPLHNAPLDLVQGLMPNIANALLAHVMSHEITNKSEIHKLSTMHFNALWLAISGEAYEQSLSKNDEFAAKLEKYIDCSKLEAEQPEQAEQADEQAQQPVASKKKKAK
ncbi:TetR/AcrR family transcriptional regulator [Psittacicella hinzii]|uniref:HTH tetR-type domain-containing protein n=1 Tax=Psittacicella hinzii TaxID=2028575 RepID=A0A3A1YP82_9GAMM|nr:TetR/AcrR family transcriptional regulator [Psittacicella hinzii]RIY39982.1 hypothetical protein CKF58_01360 [Psittacicella hinzii]